MMKRGLIVAMALAMVLTGWAQINTDRVMQMGRNALYYEDYVLSIQRFNMVINAKPYLHEPYFFRGVAKYYLEDFKGAEQDCDECLMRNPYISNPYQLRGLCRVNRDNFEGAIEDYKKVIEMEPRHKGSWHNLVLCYFELKDYAAANEAVDQMIRLWPKSAEVLNMKAQVCIAEGDTSKALVFVDSALVVDAYDAQAWTMRSMISLSRGEYAQAEAEIDKAILQKPRVAGNYINRALARFHQNNLRGAMADYGFALELEPRNYIGHFNRGLLRAQVGEDNLAIEDFNFVLSVEPDNMIALYNRALMLNSTGDYRGALRDISSVIEVYPDFMAGYQQRAEIRRKLGDVYGAERDEFKVLQARLDRKMGVKHQPKKTRKQSERDINDYASIVESDVEEPEREYASDYRGRVQDQRVDATPQAFYVLSLKRMDSNVSKFVPYWSELDAYNSKSKVAQSIFLTLFVQGQQPTDIQRFFEALERTNVKLSSTTNLQDKENLLIYRAMLNFHVRDFEASLADLEEALKLNANNAITHFLMAQLNARQYEVKSSEVNEAPSKAVQNEVEATRKLLLQRTLSVLKRVVEIAPNFAYAHYNIGNIYFMQKDYAGARKAYSTALNCDAHFPEAYYNRGLAAILDKDVTAGLSDLSQAGEYGLYQAYSLIKKYSKNTEK